MSKWIKVFGIVTMTALLGVIALSAIAFAQGPAGGSFGPDWGMRRAPFGQHGMRGPGAFGHAGPMGGDVMAEALGMSLEDFQAALAKGQSPQDIAEAQGIDWSDVEAALQASAQERIQQAVEDGKLTQKRADAILEGMAEGGFNGSFIGGPRGRFGQGIRPGGHFGGPGARRGNALAQILGMSEEDFRAAMEKGQQQVLKDIVESQGMTMSGVAEAIYEQALEGLESAVADGRLSQDQADQILEQIAESRDACVNDGDCTLKPPRPPMPFANFGR